MSDGMVGHLPPRAAPMHRLHLLVESRKLDRVAPTDDRVHALWEKALRAFADANLPQLSSESHFELSYKAAYLTSSALLAAAGYQVKVGGHHFHTFYAVTCLEWPDLAVLADEIESYRGGRHHAVYDADGEPTPAEQAGLQGALMRYLPAAYEWLLATRPTLARRLSSPPAFRPAVVYAGAAAPMSAAPMSAAPVPVAPVVPLRARSR